VADRCITLKLTETQRDAVEQATGKRIEAVTLAVDELERRAAPPNDGAVSEADAIVWECLNPYP